MAVTVAVALLFFLYGARLAPQACGRDRPLAASGAGFASTFILFPIIGIPWSMPLAAGRP
jgi:sodium/bile acid cotransporter 7